MLTNACYRLLSALLTGHHAAPALAIAVGAGAAAWDDGAGPSDRSVEALVAERGRRTVRPEAITFLDASQAPTDTPTPIVQFTVTFGPDEAVGVLRECGLIAEIEGEEVLLAYYVHERINKQASAVLDRVIRLDFTPRPVAPGTRVTDWLGNTHTRELHDLRAETSNCQIAEIAFDRRFYFGSMEAGLEADYDPCAYCLGSELSER